MKIVFLDIASVDRADLDLTKLRAMGCVFFPRTAPEQVNQRLADAHIAIVNKVVLDQAVLAQALPLRLICVAATGLNNIDLVAARERGIIVKNITNYCTDSVVQHVFALILALNTRLIDYQRDVKAGMWSRSEQFCRLDHPITQLSGKTLGIIGYGVLGQAVAHVAQAFGMRVLIAQKLTGAAAPRRIPLFDLLRQADVVSIHCPLTQYSRDLLDAQALAQMRPDALLINTARGGIVDEAALAQALREKRIAGAGFDVLSCEPPPEDHPLLAQDLSNFILTPHTAWASIQARQQAVDAVVAHIQAFQAD